MGNLLLVGGVVYVVAVLAQVLSYNSCLKKAAVERADGTFETDGAMAGHGCR